MDISHKFFISETVRQECTTLKKQRAIYKFLIEPRAASLCHSNEWGFGCLTPEIFLKLNIQFGAL